MKRTLVAVVIAALLAWSAGSADSRTDSVLEKRLRDYFDEREGDARKAALEALDTLKVTADATERAALLRTGLARPLRPGAATFQDEFGEPPLECLVWTPKGYDPSKLYPAVVSLDAMCSDASSSLSVFVPTGEAGARSTPSIDWSDGVVIAPNMGFSPHLDEFDAENFTRARARVLQAMARASRRYAIDPDRTVIAGLSMGSALAMSMAAWHPERFAAVAQVSGGCPQHPTPLKNMKTLEVYIMHGDADTTVDVSVSHENYDTLHGKMGIPCVLDIIKGGHHAWPDPLTDGVRLGKWLHEKKRNAWPTALDLVVKASCGRTRLYWIDLPPFPKNAAAKATVSNNVIALEGLDGFPSVVLHLGEPLVDLDREVVVKWKGQEVFRGSSQRSFRSLVEDFEKDGWDSVRAAPCRLEVKLASSAARKDYR